MIKILKGNIIYTKTKESFEVHEESYLIAKDHLVVGIFKELPVRYTGYLIEDYTGYLIIPSFIDLHIHAPQYMQMGIGLDLELLDWLDQYTYTLEERFSDVDYAKKVYPHFVDDLYQNGTLRAAIYGTVHDISNRYLCECLKAKKLDAYVGYVHMDRNVPNQMLKNRDDSVKEVIQWIEDYKNDSSIHPIITPRFAPSCTDELLTDLGEISRKYDLPVQSHLGENKFEIQWVKNLFPDAEHYTGVYKKYGLLGKQKSLMAHGVFLTDQEVKLINNEQTWLIHCPSANLNLTSGIMPLTRYLDLGVQIGLGSDVGAGHHMGMNYNIVSAIHCSKVLHMMNQDERVLKESEAFYLATNVNGRFFGNYGSFDEGNVLDCLVIKDPHPLMDTLTPIEQLQRFIYCGNSDSIHARYLN